MTFANGADSYDAHFYLSTEKSFMEDETARIKIESRGVSEVTVRLYQIDDPEAFIKSKKNINRVYIESEYIKRNPTEVLSYYANRLRHAFRLYGSRKLQNKETKEAAKAHIQQLFEREPTRKALFMGKFKEHTFIKEFPMKLAGDSSWNYAYIELGDLPRGLYLAEVYSPSIIGYTLVHVSKATMLIKQAESALLLRMVDKETGSGITNADISIYEFSTGKRITQGKTSSDGVFNVSFEKNRYSELMVFGRNEEEFSFYKISLYPVAETERLVYLYTNSPIYKPGDTVEIKGIIRDYDNSAYSLPDVENVSLSVTDPRDNTRLIGKTGISEFGSFLGSYETGENFPTGIYTILAAIDGKTYKGEFRVEHYVKPHFKVNTTPSKAVYVGDETVSFNVDARYFTGNEVLKGRLNYSIFRTPLREDLLESDKDIFEDPAYASRIEFLDSYTTTFASRGQEGWEVDEGMLDNLEFNFSPSQYGLDRDYVFIIKAEVRDEARAVAIGSTKVKVVKSAFFMQAQIGKSVYLPDEDVRVQTRLLYPDGQAVQHQKISYFAVLEEEAQEIVRGTMFTDEKGMASIDFPAQGKGFLRIALATEDSYQNEVVATVYTWIGQDGGTFVYTSGDITIVLDKAQYQVGETAKALVVSPVSHADALISFERENVFNYSVKQFSGNTMLLHIPITQKVVPNFFLNILFVFNNQVYEQTVKVKVPPVDRILNVELLPDKKTYLPRETGRLKVKVSDNMGKPVQAELSLAVVDEALFQLSPELAPNIWLFFYAPRWNSVSTSNAIALRFYGYSRSLRERFALDYYAKKIWDFEDFLNSRPRYAGLKEEMKEHVDQSLEAGEEERKLFKDQILWQGQLETDEQGIAEVSVTFPDNLTQWRATALAFTKDHKIGKAFSNVTTEKNFFVRLNVPRHLSYVDQAEGYVTVVNNRDLPQDVTLDLTFEQIDSLFEKQTFQLPPHGEQTFVFPLNPVQVASARLRAEVTSATEQDTLVKTIDILPISLKKIKAEVKLVHDSSEAFPIVLPKDAIAETLRLEVGLTEIDHPFGVVSEALPYLKRYPYGCVEQTTSSFLPNLIAFDAATRLGIQLPHRFDDKETLLREGLNKLYGYQHEDGSWGWWNEENPDLFMTAYVLYALSFVYDNYPDKLNRSVAIRGIQALRDMLDNWDGDDNARIYAYYVLSRFEITYWDMVDTLAENAPDSPFFLALLILTAQKTGLSDVAATLAEKLDSMAQQDGAAVFWRDAGAHYWYGSDIIATSAAVRALIVVEIPSENIEKGILHLMLQRAGSHWPSTRETAEATYAISEYAALTAETAQKYQTVEVLLGSQKVGTMEFSEQSYKNRLEIDSNLLQPGNAFLLRFGMEKGNFIANYRLEYFSGQTSIEPEAQGITLTRNYYKVIDKTTKIPLAEDPVVKTGEVLLVEIEAAASEPLDYVVIEDGFPAGFLPVFTVNEYKLEGISFYENMALMNSAEIQPTFSLMTFRPFLKKEMWAAIIISFRPFIRVNIMPCPLLDTTCINRKSGETAAVILYELKTNVLRHKFLGVFFTPKGFNSIAQGNALGYTMLPFQGKQSTPKNLCPKALIHCSADWTLAIEG